MVIPPVIARYLTNRFQRLLILSPLIGILCGAVGMYLSFYLDVSSAATIVLTAAALFFVLEDLCPGSAGNNVPDRRVFQVDPADEFG